MKLTTEHLQKIAKNEAYFSTSALVRDPIFAMAYDGFVVSKERPRSGAAGHFYTPKATKDFENSVIDCAESVIDFHYPESSFPVFFPVKMKLDILVEGPKSLPRELWHYVRPSRGDLDNKVKAITDALNGVLYKDDRQIASMNLDMVYSVAHGFRMELRRAGMSKNELAQLQKYMK